MKRVSSPVGHGSIDETIAPVTIFDAQGQVVRVVDAGEFRRSHPRDTGPEVAAALPAASRGDRKVGRLARAARKAAVTVTV